MRQLSGIDVSFLNMETPTTFGHVSSLNIYDPTGAPGGAGLGGDQADIILERIDQLAPFRRRLVEVPLGLDLPYWIEDPDFDIDFHVRHHAVPPPGNPAATRRGRQPDRRPSARPGPAAVGAVRHRGRRQRPADRPADQGAPRHDRWRRRARRCWPRSSTSTPTSGPSASRRRGCPTRCPPTRSCCGSRSREYLRRPEKLMRSACAPCASWPRRRSRAGCARSPTWSPNRCRARVGKLMRNRLRRSTATDDDRPPALPPTQAPRTPWNRPITPHRRFAYTTIPLGRCEDRAPRVRLHVQRCRDGAVLRHAASLPDQHDCLPTDEPDRDGAGQRAQRQRERRLPEPGVGAARRPGDQRARSGASGCGACSRA